MRDRLLTRLRSSAPWLAIAVLAVAIAWSFAVTVLRHTWPMGLPLDDSYAYLASARQLGRGGFAALSGGLWPIVLAPFWLLGARGHALVWVSFVVSSALYVATVVGVARVIEPIGGKRAAVIGAGVTLAIAPFAWAALSGTEVALTSALVVDVIRRLRAAPRTGAPPWPLALGLVAVALSYPALVIAIVGVAAIGRRCDGRAAAWWLAPLAAPLAWLIAHRLVTGHGLPGVAPSSLPGFDTGHGLSGFDVASGWEVVTSTGRLLRGLFWDATGPFVWPTLFALAWLAGAVRVAWWARRERQHLVGAVILGAPFAILLAAIAWSVLPVDRAVAPAFPLLAIPVGCAFAPIRRAAIVHAAISIAVAIVVAIAAIPGLVASARRYAQGAVTLNTGVAAIGDFVHRKLPAATVLAHAAGAIAYLGDVPVLAMPAEIANHGPGAQFEFLDNLPVEQRVTHFASSPARMGTSEFFAADLLHTRDPGLQLLVADWDHTGTGRRPLTPHPGWAIVDRINVADLASEAAHRWIGALDPGDLPAARSMIGRSVGASGLVLDGGRTIRGGRERFTLTVDPARPVRLLLRTGGARAYPSHEAIASPVTLRILDVAGRELARATLPPPDGRFVEVAFALPAGLTTVHTQADSPYRVFHWFALQPD